MILPGATLGMLGGGQLGRMFTVAALTMGYKVIVLDPNPQSPAGKLATEHLCADYLNPKALDYLGKTCAAVTTEFENVPAASLDTLAQRCLVRPGATAVAITQNRVTEKLFLRDGGFATTPFAVVHSEADLVEAFLTVSLPGILKVARFGYDGKGQFPVAQFDDALQAYRQLNQEVCVLEQRATLECELAVLLARSADGTISVYPLAENQHKDGILDITIVPARVSPAVAQQAEAMARRIAEQLQYVGVLAVEFFYTQAGQLLVNEIAPRPHNSGHYTIDACATSQFEQQVRALCGLALGDTRLLSPVAMVNLLGDLWPPSGEPNWRVLMRYPHLKLHLYGKDTPRAGRKMGHFCLLDPQANDALAHAMELKNELILATH